VGSIFHGLGSLPQKAARSLPGVPVSPREATFLGCSNAAVPSALNFTQHNHTDANMIQVGEDVHIFVCRLCLYDIEVAYLDVSSITIPFHTVESRSLQHQAEDVGDDPTNHMFTCPFSLHHARPRPQ
jgi:hypothetical protein